MSTPTIGVVVFPGSNCDRDAAAAWTELGFGNVKMLWHQDTDLTGVDAVIVPGGFSYGVRSQFRCPWRSRVWDM